MSKLLKRYRRWHFILLYQILGHSDQRFLRFKLQKFGDFHIYPNRWQNGLKDVSCPPTWLPPLSLKKFCKV